MRTTSGFGILLMKCKNASIVWKTFLPWSKLCDHWERIQETSCQVLVSQTKEGWTEKASCDFVLPVSWNNLFVEPGAELVGNKDETIKLNLYFPIMEMFSMSFFLAQVLSTIANPRLDLSVDEQIKLLSLWSKPILSKAKRSDLTEWMQIFVLREHFGWRKCDLHKIWSAALCVQ